MGRPRIPDDQKAQNYTVTLHPDRAKQLRAKYGSLTKALITLIKAK
jgi:hypothetical protein